MTTSASSSAFPGMYRSNTSGQLEWSSRGSRTLDLIVQFEISRLSQITADLYNESKGSLIRGLNKAVKYAVDNRVQLKKPTLSVKSLKVVLFLDSSFSNNADLSS